MIKHYLNFITGGEGKKQIDEPDGFDSAKFSLMQEDKRYGRDISFAGGESNFVLNRKPEHEFELVNKYFEVYGFESVVEYIIEHEGNELKYEVDFASMDNNQTDTISFKAIQKSKQILLKRRNDVNVDLLSSKTLDGEDIQPCVPENVLIKAKSISGVSQWESTPDTAVAQARALHNGSGAIPQIRTRIGANNAMVVKKEGVKNTLSFISPEYGLISSRGGIPDNGVTFTYIEAEDDLYNVKIELRDIIGYTQQRVTHFDVALNPVYVKKGNGNIKIQIRVGFDIEDAETQIFNLYSKDYSYNLNTAIPSLNTISPELALPTELSLSLPIVKRGQRIWIYINPMESATFETNRTVASPANYVVFASLQSWNINITSESLSYSTVNTGIRLYDAMKYVVKSSSGMDISAPDYELGGVFYDQFIFTGNFLRNITDKGFKISFKDILDYIPEINADYQITTDDKVYFGNYKEFYKENEIAVIENVQFEEFKKYFNEKYKLNVYKFKYSNYQSQKEANIENTIDVVNGESEWLLANKNVENKKEIDIKFIRDAFQIEENRKKAYDITETVESQDDDKKFLLDCRLLEFSERTFSTTSFLQHSTLESKLVLKNTGSFSFFLLGIREGDIIRILPGNENAGSYTVNAVSGNTLTLNALAGTSITFSGETNTQLSYTVSVNTVRYTNWTNQGFTQIQNIANPDNFANLRFTVKRNIINYWNQYLATANIFNKTKPIKNTLYKNNPKAITTYAGVTVEEDGEFVPSNPILSTYMYDCTFDISFSEFIEIERKTRDERGFIRFIDALGNVTRGYISKAEFLNTSSELGELQCTFEEKYDPEILKIFSDNISGVVMFNDYISVDSKNWSWTIDELGYLRIFDATGLLLFTKAYFDRVTVNGAFFTNSIDLEKSLNLL